MELNESKSMKILVMELILNLVFPRVDHFYSTSIWYDWSLCECEDSDVANDADNTTPYSCPADIPSVALELQASVSKLFRWFKNNHLKAKPRKSLILLGTKKPEIVSIDEISLAASSQEKLLGSYDRLGIKVSESLQSYVSKLAKNLTHSAVYQVYVIRKMQNINESIYRSTNQLLPLNMDASF